MIFRKLILATTLAICTNSVGFAMDNVGTKNLTSTFDRSLSTRDNFSARQNSQTSQFYNFFHVTSGFFSNFRRFDGFATITRDGNSLTLDATTRNLKPEWAYTTWIATFNRPKHCKVSCGCSLEDLENPAARPGLIFGSGRVADEWGQANFKARVNYTQSPHTDLGDVDRFTTDTYRTVKRSDVRPEANARWKPGAAAEVHVVVRAHGKAGGFTNDSKVLERQLSRFNGGCQSQPGDLPGLCRDEQVAVIPSPYCE